MRWTRAALFTGNRGIIHDPATKTLLRKRWTTKAWIICSCEYKGVRREPMGRNGPNGKAGWTELFFLDEVTALAAGHRPCFTCRRERAKEFAACLRDSAVNVARADRPEIDADPARRTAAHRAGIVHRLDSWACLRSCPTEQ